MKVFGLSLWGLLVCLLVTWQYTLLDPISILLEWLGIFLPADAFPRLYGLLEGFMAVSAQGVALAALACGVYFIVRRLRCSKTVCLLLWAVVALRLFLPVQIPSPLSLFNLDYFSGIQTAVARELDYEFTGDYEYTVPGWKNADAALEDGADIVPGGHPKNQLEFIYYYEDEVTGAITAAVSREDRFGGALALIWMGGTALLLGYSVVSYVLLKRRLRFAVKDDALPGVRYSDRIVSPCVVGFFRPQIYLPFGLSDLEKSHILAHEGQHIKNGDHIWKLIAWLVVCLHWMTIHPLLLLLFYGVFLWNLEEACDQRVLRQLGEDQKADYSQSLLTLSTGRPFRPGSSPIAFGEGDAENRIRSILRYKQPLAVLSALVLAAAIILGATLATNRVEEKSSTDDPATPTATLDPVESAPEIPDEDITSDWEDLVLTWTIRKGSYPADNGFPLTFAFPFDFFDASVTGTPYAYKTGELLSGHPIQGANGQTLYWWPYQEGDSQPLETASITAAVYLDGEQILACSLIFHLTEETGDALTYSVRATLHGYDEYVWLKNPQGSGGMIRPADSGLPETLATWPVDLTHDGTDETVTVVGDYGQQVFYVTVCSPSGQTLWSGTASTSHAGQNGIYLYEEDNEYYLMEWCNYGSSGIYSISCRVFSFTDLGENVALTENILHFEADDFMSVDVAALRAAEEESQKLLSSSIVLVSTNGDTPDGQYFSTPEHPIIPILGQSMWGGPPSADYFEALQAKAQGTYSFRGEVVAVFEDSILVEDQSLWIDTGDYHYFMVPVDDPTPFAEGDLVRVTADGPLYRRDLPDEDTSVEVWQLIID